MSKEIIQYCDEPCEMGWLPGCCLCKRKSEFSFTVLLKSCVSAVISYIVTQIIFPILLLHSTILLFPFSITSLSFLFPVFTLRFPLIFVCQYENTLEPILCKLFISYSQISWLTPSSLPVTVKVQHLVACSSWFSVSPSLLLKRRLLFLIIIFFVIIFFWICCR